MPFLTYSFVPIIPLAYWVIG